MKARMEELEGWQLALDRELAHAEAPPARLHPGLAAIYRAKVAALHAALATEDGGEVREAIRALIDSIVLTPEAGELAIEVKGDLAAILALASGTKTGASLTANQALVQGIKMVAGRGFEPLTFRL